VILIDGSRDLAQIGIFCGLL